MFATLEFVMVSCLFVNLLVSRRQTDGKESLASAAVAWVKKTVSSKL